MKKCSQCSTEKSLDAFFNDKHTKSGKSPACKECVYARRKSPVRLAPIPPRHKRCNGCFLIKPLDDFFLDKANKTDGRYSHCKLCKTAATYKWRAANQAKYNETCRVANRKRYPEARLQRYNLSKEDYDKMLLEQKGLCAIPGCGRSATKKRELAIDHCHATGKVRGLLCYKCNRDMNVLDNEAHLAQLKGYKDKHSA